MPKAVVKMPSPSFWPRHGTPRPKADRARAVPIHGLDAGALLRTCDHLRASLEEASRNVPPPPPPPPPQHPSSVSRKRTRRRGPRKSHSRLLQPPPAPTASQSSTPPPLPPSWVDLKVEKARKWERTGAGRTPRKNPNLREVPLAAAPQAEAGRSRPRPRKRSRQSHQPAPENPLSAVPSPPPATNPEAEAKKRRREASRGSGAPTVETEETGKKSQDLQLVEDDQPMARLAKAHREQFPRTISPGERDDPVRWGRAVLAGASPRETIVFHFWTYLRALTPAEFLAFRLEGRGQGLWEWTDQQARPFWQHGPMTHVRLCASLLGREEEVIRGESQRLRRQLSTESTSQPPPSPGKQSQTLPISPTSMTSSATTAAQASAEGSGTPAGTTSSMSLASPTKPSSACGETPSPATPAGKSSEEASDPPASSSGDSALPSSVKNTATPQPSSEGTGEASGRGGAAPSVPPPSYSPGKTTGAYPPYSPTPRTSPSRSLSCGASLVLGEEPKGSTAPTKGDGPSVSAAATSDQLTCTKAVSSQSTCILTSGLGQKPGWKMTPLAASTSPAAGSTPSGGTGRSELSPSLPTETSAKDSMALESEPLESASTGARLPTRGEEPTPSPWQPPPVMMPPPAPPSAETASSQTSNYNSWLGSKARADHELREFESFQLDTQRSFLPPTKVADWDSSQLEETPEGLGMVEETRSETVEELLASD